MARESDLSDCRACVCFAIRRAARAITQHYDRHLRPMGLRATQFSLLVVLSNAGPLPLHRVAEILGMERTTLTRNLRALIKAGHVIDEPSSDKRVRLIALTPGGAGIAARAKSHWRKAQRHMENQLSPSAVQVLGELSRLSF